MIEGGVSARLAGVTGVVAMGTRGAERERGRMAADEEDDRGRG